MVFRDSFDLAYGDGSGTAFAITPWQVAGTSAIGKDFIVPLRGQSHRRRHQPCIDVGGVSATLTGASGNALILLSTDAQATYAIEGVAGTVVQ